MYSYFTPSVLRKLNNDATKNMLSRRFKISNLIFQPAGKPAGWKSNNDLL
jgi:hypothetical protein